MPKQASEAKANVREAILATAKKAAQSRGYAGLNFRELAEGVGIKHASLYYYFATKADLGAAVAQRYWQDTAGVLEELLAHAGSAEAALRDYPKIFRKSLEDDNRLCLVSFMSAEYDELPDNVKAQVQAFADVNVAWLTKVLKQAGMTPTTSAQRAVAIYAAVAGAQLMARGRSDLALFDALIDAYQGAGLFTA